MNRNINSSLSLPNDLFENTQQYSTYDTGDIIPPYSTTDCEINETHNSSPILLKSSMYKIPANKVIFNTVRLPIGIVVNPFSSKYPINFNNNADMEYGISCVECSTYLCNFTVINEFKREYICHICLHTNKLNEIPTTINPTMIYNLNETIKKYESDFVDRDFCRNSRKKQQTTILIIDISTNSILYEEYIKGLRVYLNLQKNLSIILFNQNEVEIVTVNKMNRIIIKKILNDEVFIPISYTIPVLTTEICEGVYEYLLNKVNTVKEGSLNKESGNKGGRYAIKLAIEFSKNFYGSQTILLSNNQLILSSEDYNTFIDHFIEESNSLSLIELKKRTESSLSRFIIETNGLLISLNKQEDIENSIKEILNRKVFYGIQVNIKTSNSLSKSRLYANTKPRTGVSSFISQLSNLDTFTVSISLSEKMKNKEKCYIQIQVSFYDETFNRKILILNQEYFASESVEEVYEYLMFDSLLNVFLRYVTDDLQNLDVRFKNINRMFIESLRSYKQQSQRKGSSLLIPSSLKSFFVLINAFHKHQSFVNKEFYGLRELVNLPCSLLVNVLYPRLVNFNDFCLENEVKCKELRFKGLDQTEIYLMELEKKILIYIPPSVDTSLQEAVFSYKPDESNKQISGVNDSSEEGLLMKELLQLINKEKAIQVISAGSGDDMEFLNRLVEDQVNGIPSLKDYLKGLYFSIENTK